MIGLGWMEVLILLVCAGMFIVIPAVVVISILVSRSSEEPAPTAAAPPSRSPAGYTADDADLRQTIIARLSQRFCPQCRSPLAPDSPEGLCPACLMVGGLASAAVEPAVD